MSKFKEFTFAFFQRHELVSLLLIPFLLIRQILHLQLQVTLFL